MTEQRLGIYITAKNMASQAFKQANSQLKQMQAQSEKARASLGSLTTLVGVGLVGALALGMQSGLQFSEKMAEVKAISGATAKQFEELSAQAKELGKTTKFSATQAAQGQAFLARAGFKTNEVLSAMPDVLNLATAGNLELGRAADITSNIMGQFQIQAENTAKVSNLLAATAASSNTNVEQLGEAMKYLGPTSKSLGISIEETASIIGALGDAGIQGSLAGRALGTSLVNLAKIGSTNRKALDELGVSAFDASGKFVGMKSFIEQLNTQMRGFNPEMRSAAIATIFGAEAVQEISILLDKGADKFEEYTKSITGTNKAAEIAKVQMEGLHGEFVELRSATEGVFISLTQALTPALSALFSSLKSGAKFISDFIDQNRQTATILATLTAAVLTLKFALIPLTTLLISSTLATKGFSAALAANPIGAVVVAVSGLVLAFDALIKTTDELNMEIEKNSKKMLENEATLVQLAEKEKALQKELKAAKKAGSADLVKIKEAELLEISRMSRASHDQQIALQAAQVQASKEKTKSLISDLEKVNQKLRILEGKGGFFENLKFQFSAEGLKRNFGFADEVELEADLIREKLDLEGAIESSKSQFERFSAGNFKEEIKSASETAEESAEEIVDANLATAASYGSLQSESSEKLQKMEADHTKNVEKISAKIGDLQRSLLDLKEDYEKSIGSIDAGIGEKFVEQEKKIKKLKSQLAGESNGDQKSELAAQLKKEEEALRNFSEQAKGFEEEITEARRRAGLTDFERFIEDQNAKKEELTKNFNEKAAQIEAELQMQEEQLVEEKRIFEEKGGVVEKFKEVYKRAMTNVENKTRSTTEAVQQHLSDLESALARIKALTAPPGGEDNRTLEDVGRSISLPNSAAFQGGDIFAAGGSGKASSNTTNNFGGINFSGITVRSESDIDQIVAQVEDGLRRQFDNKTRLGLSQ